jgi:hypothetical protein
MQWDKAEVIYKEENRITTEMEELLMITTYTTKPVHKPYVSPYSTRQKTTEV